MRLKICLKTVLAKLYIFLRVSGAQVMIPLCENSFNLVLYTHYRCLCDRRFSQCGFMCRGCNQRPIFMTITRSKTNLITIAGLVLDTLATLNSRDGAAPRQSKPVHPHGAQFERAHPYTFSAHIQTQ